MEQKHPLHPEEITVDWINFALKESGTVKESTIKDIKKDTIGGGKGFLSSVVKVDLNYDKPEPGAPGSVVVKIEPEPWSCAADPRSMHRRARRRADAARPALFEHDADRLIVPFRNVDGGVELDGVCGVRE